MTDTPKSAALRAEEYAINAHGRHRDDSIDRENTRLDFLAGREDFIANDLPGLLEKAREWDWLDSNREDIEFDYTIEQILEEARKK